VWHHQAATDRAQQQHAAVASSSWPACQLCLACAASLSCAGGGCRSSTPL
jgi:hypothetical protein